MPNPPPRIKRSFALPLRFSLPPPTAPRSTITRLPHTRSFLLHTSPPTATPSHTLAHMPLAQQRRSRIRFVGLEHLNWPTDASEGTRSWSFEHPIDRERLTVGSRISILREKPPNPSALLGQHSLRIAQSPPIPLLEGVILGLEAAAEGIVTFTITDDFAGGLSTIRAPAKYTTLARGGGWSWKAKPLALGYHRGWTLRYPTRVGADSLRRPKTERAQPRVQLMTFAQFDDL